MKKVKLAKEHFLLNGHLKGKFSKGDVVTMDSPPPTCGGKAKPAIPPGQYGDFVCTDGEWVWIPFIG